MLVKLTILVYCTLHGFFSVCDYCLQDQRFWTPYYIVDGISGGGVMLWFFTYRYCRVINSKYKIAALMTTFYAVFMLLWNIVIPIFGYNRSGTKWSFLLSLALLVPIYWAVFAPGGQLTRFLDENFKRIGM